MYIIASHRRKGWILYPGGKMALPMSSGKAAGSADVPARSWWISAVCSSFRAKRVPGLLPPGGVAGQPLQPLALISPPFYSPELFGSSPQRPLRSQAGLVPSFLRFTLPALLILWIPGLFRLTCYYYRGAYYKSFWADPPACAVSEPRKKYLGERSFPLILQNSIATFYGSPTWCGPSWL